VYEFGEANGTYYIAMEFIHGEDLGRVMRKAWSVGQWIARPLAIRIVASACEGLYYAHTRTDANGKPLKVVHRDISPQNILVAFDGSVKVVDFGIAKAADLTSLTRSGFLKGRFAYMAPEQAAGEVLDHRVDIFAVGLVLYELLTGVRPLKRETEPATLKAALECKIQPPSEVADVPEELDALVMSALARKPSDRYRDARQFQIALEETLVAHRWVASSVQLSELMEVLFADRLEKEKSGDLDSGDESFARSTPPTVTARASERATDKLEISWEAPPGEISHEAKRGRTSVLSLAEAMEEYMAPSAAPAGAVPRRAQAPQPVAARKKSQGVPGTALFTWLHLSDIHVGYSGAGDRWDQQLVLEALRRDVSKLRTRDAPLPEAILVTGDITFSGFAAQYDESKAWLLELAGTLGLDSRHVFTVPGNHDVERAVDRNRSVGRLVRALRESNESLDDVLAHKEDCAYLAQRMGNYLKFAAEFAPACLQNHSPPSSRLSWVHRLKTRGGARVRLVGLNTALLAADDSDRGKLRLGKQALAHAFTRPPLESGEIALVLSHHPLRDGWLADEREAEAWIRQHAYLHISGHVHEASTEDARAGSGGGLVRISAGAVHDKSQPGVPAGHGYNLASIVLDEEGSIQLRVWPRLWSDKNKDFRLDIHNVPPNREYAEHLLMQQWNDKERGST
jgi:hypothetical protein